MISLTTKLKTFTLIATVGSAFCSLKSAMITSPATMSLTLDRTNFDDLLKPLAEQGTWSTYASWLAALAVMLQVVEFFIDHRPLKGAQ